MKLNRRGFLGSLIAAAVAPKVVAAVPRPSLTVAPLAEPIVSISDYPRFCNYAVSQCVEMINLEPKTSYIAALQAHEKTAP